MKKSIILSVITLATTVSALSAAPFMACKNLVIDLNKTHTMSEIIEHCGKPDLQTVDYEDGYKMDVLKYAKYDGALKTKSELSFVKDKLVEAKTEMENRAYDL